MNIEQAAYMSGHPPAQYIVDRAEQNLQHILDLALPVLEKLE